MTTYYVDPGNANVVAWQANHVYSEGDYVCPTDLTTADAKSVYECTTGGTSHASTEPTWDEIVGNTTSDGTVTWTARAPDSWDEALLSLQPAADLAVAGDVVYCQGTQLLSVAIDFDTNSGTYDGGYIKFIGVKDGTTAEPPTAADYDSSNGDSGYFILNGQDNNIDGLYLNEVNHIWLENIKIHSCNGTAGINTSKTTSSYLVMQNVWIHDNDGHGLSGGLGYIIAINLIRCRFTNNTGNGLLNPVYAQIVCCEVAHNGGDGLYNSNVNNYLCCVDCIFHHNGGSGAFAYRPIFFINCIFDGNGSHGVECMSPWSPLFVGCRFTNNNQASKLGIAVHNYVSRVGLLGCYFGNNATDITASRYDIIPIDGTTTNVTLAGSETDHGYVDPANHDFNLDATKAANTRSIAVELP